MRHPMQLLETSMTSLFLTEALKKRKVLTNYHPLANRFPRSPSRGG